MSNEPKTELAIAGDKISSGLVAFEERKEKLTLLVSESVELVIKDVNDRQGIKKVYEARQKLKSERVDTKKEGLEMRSVLTKMSKDIIEKEKELVDIILPEEERLQKMEDDIESEKEKIAAEKKAAKDKLIQDRIDKLAAFNYAIDYAAISLIDDAGFIKLLDGAELEFKAYQYRKAEEEKVAKIEADRIEAEHKEQQLKIEQERQELELLRKQHAEAQKIIDENNARIAKEQKDKEDTIIAEQKRIDDEKSAIELQKKNEEIARQREIEYKRIANDAAEKARLKAIDDARIEAENKAKAEASDIAEAIRQESLRPDKEKLQSFSDYLSDLKLPVVSSIEGQAVVNEIQLMVNKMQAYILKKVAIL